MKGKSLFALLLVLLLTACGPLIGGFMTSGNGVKDLKVLKGALADLPAGKELLVIAPFATTAESFYICRGEDASTFVEAFNESGLFQADFYMPERFADNSARIAALKKMTPAALKSELKLAVAPRLLLTGTVVKRETVAAPAKGVLMRVTYRLDFYDLETGKSTVVEIAAQDYFQKCIRTVVKELTRRLLG